MPIFAEGAFQLYHQRDTRRPSPFGEPFGRALASTTDFVDYVDHGDGYAFTLRPGEQRLDFDRIPNYPWFRYDNRGLERPLVLDPGRSYDIDVIIDGTIAKIYVDGVALNARMYSRAGDRLSDAVVDGEVTIERASVARPDLGRR